MESLKDKVAEMDNAARCAHYLALMKVAEFVQQG